MGIPESDIIWINHSDVSTHDGEECIFPVVSFLQNIESIGTYSNKLHPVFICYVTFTPFTVRESEILKRYEPIGCRDAYTLNECRKNKIAAYFNGCITATLPRNYGQRNDQVVLSDIDPELKPFIPKKYMKNVVHVCHNTKITNLNEYKNRALELLRLFGESSLCITSRLHCASPSMAAGTPIVFAKNKLSSRFGWIDRFLPIYAREDYLNIDWNPVAVNYEPFKEKVMCLVMKRLNSACRNEPGIGEDIIQLIADVSVFYEARPQKQYTVAFDKFASAISERKNKNDVFEYAFFGYSHFHHSLFDFIQKTYPNAKLTHIYDDFRNDYRFNDLKAVPVSISKNNPKELIICFCASQVSLDKMRKILKALERDPKNFIADFYQE
jgi:hypothetical protein